MRVLSPRTQQSDADQRFDTGPHDLPVKDGVLVISIHFSPTYRFSVVSLESVLKKIENISSFVFRDIFGQIVRSNILLRIRKDNCFIFYVKFLFEKKREIAIKVICFENQCQEKWRNCANLCCLLLACITGVLLGSAS